MAVTSTTPVPLQQALDELDRWQADPSPEQRERLRVALLRLITAVGAEGAYLDLTAAPLPELSLGIGSLPERPVSATSQPSAGGLGAARKSAGAGGSGATGKSAGPGGPVRASEQRLFGADGSVLLGTVWLAGPADAVEQASEALGLAVDAAWSRAEARSALRRLSALDAAVRGIAGVLSLDRVLQLIVDRVRELSDAQYAALGIVGDDDYLERFLTSGMSDLERTRIGALPRGRGLLGLIIREDRSFRIADIGSDPHSHGFPAHHPPMSSFLGVPVRSKGRSVGNLYLTNKQGASSFSEADQRLVEMFALHAGIAIENARLHEEVGRLAVLEDRQRISQDLHDGIIQGLYAVALSLEDVPEMMTDEPVAGSARIDRAIDAIHQTIRDIRNFILGLEPELFEGADLATGLSQLAVEFRVNTLIDLELHLPDSPATPPAAITTNLLTMTREALSNIARHSAATRATAELSTNMATLRMVIGDNGRGFDPHAPRTGEHHGLNNLHSRAAALGGRVEIVSELGVGTRVEITVPLETPSAMAPDPA